MKMMRVRTYSANAADAKAGQRWYVIDAEGQVLGRVATTVAQIIRGKDKPSFTPHMDCGDYVIVVNADKIVVTGNKEEQKIYYRHSNYPGGLRATKLKDMRAKHPTRILEAAVKGMLPKNPLGEKLFHHLKAYAGPNHPHESQQPERLELRVEGHKRGQIMRSSVPAVAVEAASEEARRPIAVADVLAEADAHVPAGTMPATTPTAE